MHACTLRWCSSVDNCDAVLAWGFVPESIVLSTFVSLLQIAYAASDEVLATGGYDQAIRLWDCRSRSFEPIQTMKNFGDAVTSVAVADEYASMRCTKMYLASVMVDCWLA